MPTYIILSMNNTIGSCTTNAIKGAQSIQYCQQLMIVINVHGASTWNLFCIYPRRVMIWIHLPDYII